MRRLGPGLLAAALVLALVGVAAFRPPSAPAARRAPDAVGARPQVARPAPRGVVLFGDSLAHQARPALEARLPGDPTRRLLSTRPGAALCDDRTYIARALMTRRPDVLVLEYSGNSFTDCMRDAAGELLTIGSRAWSSRYETDLRSIATIASTTGTTVVWVTAPPVRHVGAPVDYPERIAAVARRVASDRPDLRVADTGAALTSKDDGRYAGTLRCEADETWLCADGRIVVRASDRLHFDCHGFVDPMGGCVGYSAGGRRYADAIAAALTTLAPPTPSGGGQAAPKRGSD